MSLKALVLLLTITFGACNSVHTNANSPANKTATPAPAAAQSNDGIRRITTADLDNLMKQGKVLVLDVRTKDMYDRGHIRGAKLIPVQEVGQRAKELPRDKTIVTYCS